MDSSKSMSFGVEMAKIMPILIREIGRRQKLFFEGKLPVPFVVVLDILRERGECKMTDIAGMMNITMSAATAIIDKMIEAKLVKRERSTDDRRVVKASLTKKGIELAMQIVEWRIEMSEELYQPLSEKEKDEYIQMLNKVKNNIVEKYENE